METYRVLVTGCSGFLGRSVVAQLNKDGHDVVGFDLVEPSYRIATYQKGDFTSVADLRAALQGINGVCHLGGIGDVYVAEGNPALAFRANAFGTKVLCDECLRSRVERLVYASTWEVYGKPQTDTIDEAHPCNPESAYSISKLAGELFVRRAGTDEPLKTVSLRLGTAYGPRMRDTAVIASFARRAANRKPIQIYGDGGQFRQFTHAEDIARGFSLALRARTPDLIYNMVSDERVTIADLAGIIARRFDVPIEHQQMRAAEPPSALISSAKARRDLGWSRTIKFTDGLDGFLRNHGNPAAQSPSGRA